MKKCLKCGRTFDDKWKVCPDCTKLLVDPSKLDTDAQEVSELKKILSERKKELAMKYLRKLGWTGEDINSTAVLVTVLGIGFIILAILSFRILP